MRIFLTGGTGFIGHYVAKSLLSHGHELHISTRHPKKIPSLAETKGVSFFQGALCDTDVLQQAIQGCDACIHIALGWGETPTTMLKNDTLATATLLELAANAGCEKFIYTSSTAAMGQMRPSMDETCVNLPVDLYGATKAAGEAYVLGFRRSGMKRNIIRPGYTFGNPAFPDGCSQPDTRFAKIAEAVLNNQPIHIIKNDGTQFIHASQQAEVFTRLIESNLNEEIFLALGETWISWKEIAERAIALVPGCSSQIIEEDLGWSKSPMFFSVRKISEVFGLQFDSRPFLDSHINYYLEKLKK